MDDQQARTVLLVASSARQTGPLAALLVRAGLATSFATHPEVVTGVVGSDVSGAVVYPVISRQSAVAENHPGIEGAVARDLFPVLAAARSVTSQVAQRAGGGSVVVLASHAGLGAVHGASLEDHAVAGAVCAAVRSLAAEYGPLGVRVNAVTTIAGTVDEAAPCWAPLGRTPMASGEAAAVCWLLGEFSPMVTGHVLSVDAGQSAVVGATSSGFPVPSNGTVPLDKDRWQ